VVLVDRGTVLLPLAPDPALHASQNHTEFHSLLDISCGGIIPDDTNCDFRCGTQNLSGNIYPADPLRICWALILGRIRFSLAVLRGSLFPPTLFPNACRILACSPRWPWPLLSASAYSQGLLLFFFHGLCGVVLGSVLAAIIILQLTMCSDTILHAVFGFRPLAFVGQISYGLYLGMGPYSVACEIIIFPGVMQFILRLQFQ